MTRPRSAVQLAALVELVRTAADRWPATVAHAATIAADGWPLRGDTAGRASGAGSTVEAAVIARTTGTGTGYRVSDLIQLAEQQIAIAAEAVAILLDVEAKLAPPPAMTAALRCTGGMGIDGADDWGDPTCTELRDGRPSRMGLCDKHYLRFVRWQARQEVA